MACHCQILAIDAVQRGLMGACTTHALCDNIAAIVPGHFDEKPTHHPCEDSVVNDIVLDPIRNTDRPSQINAKHCYTDPSHFVLLFPNEELGYRPNLCAGDSLHSCVAKHVCWCIFLAPLSSIWVACRNAYGM